MIDEGFSSIPLYPGKLPDTLSARPEDVTYIVRFCCDDTHKLCPACNGDGLLIHPDGPEICDTCGGGGLVRK